ncbi:MAG: hypothetical protein WBM83_15810, partial [Flavobacteriaceae bacterium]
MKLHLAELFCFSSLICFAQHRHQGIVVDADGKEPLEFVGIYNDQAHTMTNSDGQFLFSTTLDSVTYYRVGYEKFKTTIDQLGDTVYLQKSILELDE